MPIALVQCSSIRPPVTVLSISEEAPRPPVGQGSGYPRRFSSRALGLDEVVLRQVFYETPNVRRDGAQVDTWVFL